MSILRITASALRVSYTACCRSRNHARCWRVSRVRASVSLNTIRESKKEIPDALEGGTPGYTRTLGGRTACLIFQSSCAAPSSVRSLYPPTQRPLPEHNPGFPQEMKPAVCQMRGSILYQPGSLPSMDKTFGSGGFLEAPVYRRLELGGWYRTIWVLYGLELSMDSIDTTAIDRKCSSTNPDARIALAAYIFAASL